MTEWSESLEKLFKKQAEHFLCLRYAHDSAQRFCSQANTYLTIPVIILSGLAGLGSVGSESLLPFQNSSILVGFISFTAGTLQTISSYFAFAKRAEGHRVAALSFEKLHRHLEFQLKVDRPHRVPPDELIKVLKEETDRLNEVSPQIPSHTIQEFKKRFPTVSVAVPTVLNGLEPVELLAPPRPSSPAPSPSEPRVQIRVEV